MADLASRVRALRERQRFIDPITQEVVEKPQPPGMRTILKGAWTYKDVTPEPQKTDDRKTTTAKETLG